MAGFRQQLPQLGEAVFLTDSGIETDLLFNHGINLPEFAAFPLVADPVGRALLRQYFADHVAIAVEHGVGIVLDAPTWRASSGWGARLGLDAARLEQLNRECVELVAAVASDAGVPAVVSAAIGPEGDGYVPARYLGVDAATAYHLPQIETLAATDTDLVHAMTMSYVDEALGIVRAAQSVGVPVAVSFTVETDGALPDGTPLGDAVNAVDDQTGGGPVYYGINCAHPTHFRDALDPAAEWVARIRCVRANASTMSHAELDEAPALDPGDPAELAAQYADLLVAHPHLTVLGGCCGTDVRHVRAIADACL